MTWAWIRRHRGPLPITASRMGHLLEVLVHAYRMLGFGQAGGGNEVFEQLVLARIMELVSKADNARVLEEGRRDIWPPRRRRAGIDD